MFNKNPFIGVPILLFILITSCKTSQKLPVAVKEKPVLAVAKEPVNLARTDLFFEQILKSYPQYFDSILQNRKGWNVQVIYTQVDRAANGIPTLTNYFFNLDTARYFYPASTIKLPICLLALQKLHELKVDGLDLNSTMITEQDYSGQTAVYNDPTTPDGKPTIANYIKKVMLVSDNDAYNRLYEFLGQEYINTQLQRMGYHDVQILHRLGIILSPDQNSHTNSIKFFNGQNKLIYEQAAQFNTGLYSKRKDSLGLGYLNEGQLINRPMDFSGKNRASLEDLHRMLISLIFPNQFGSAQRFGLSEPDRKFILRYMSQLQTETAFPPYAADTVNYWPAREKFLLLGAAKGKIPPAIRIFNKSGDAYGQLTDVAYIVDQERKIEFFLSATIYCNQDGVLNDDRYDYESVGLPFMKRIGQLIYNYESKRNRKNAPDLSNLIYDYVK